MGTDDKVRNEIDEKTGQAKECVGEHTDNADLANEGRGEQVEANARKAGEHVKDAAHSAGEHLRDAADDLKDAAHRD